MVERLRTEAQEIREDAYPRWKNADETMDYAADEIEGLRAALGECLTREAKMQKILDGLNTHLAAWREDY